MSISPASLPHPTETLICLTKVNVVMGITEVTEEHISLVQWQEEEGHLGKEMLQLMAFLFLTFALKYELYHDEATNTVPT